MLPQQNPNGSGRKSIHERVEVERRMTTRELEQREQDIRARMAIVRTRPQFQIRHRVVLMERGNNGPRIIQIHFRNGNILEGVEHDVLQTIEDRIRVAAIISLREEEHGGRRAIVGRHGP